ncbi:type II toxin-antitoxin system RelE/ParE family toxin [Serratia aquatilis]|uniref:Type II toxin-antitoxin system RelE/ParE family toxin n=1 Tax=Serratia aquatilis TaxID=1737515 RepID=A0ABV6EDT2_9GAMM
MNIQYTFTVKVCIDEITSHLRHLDIAPKAVITDILEYFEKKVTEFPLGCQVCPELHKIGCTKYRECNTPGGYRVLYSVDETAITVHAILAHRQDIKQLLFKRLISV